jgi:hypothetical protein
MMCKVWATVLRLERNASGSRLSVWSPILVEDWADEAYVKDWAKFYYPDFNLVEISKVDPNGRKL